MRSAHPVWRLLLPRFSVVFVPCVILLVAFAFHPLAHELAIAAHGLGLLTHATLGRLFVRASPLHLAERPLALHLLLEGTQRLVDVVVADENLHEPPWFAISRENADAGRGDRREPYSVPMPTIRRLTSDRPPACRGR